MAQSTLNLKVVGIDHTVLRVSDLERSKRWYTEFLGMTLNDFMNEKFGHQGLVFLWAGKNQLVLAQAKPDDPVKPGGDLSHIAFLLDSGTHDEVMAHLQAGGYEVRIGNPRCIYFTDPDGHGLEVVTTDHE